MGVTPIASMIELHKKNTLPFMSYFLLPIVRQMNNNKVE